MVLFLHVPKALEEREPCDEESGGGREAGRRRGEVVRSGEEAQSQVVAMRVLPSVCRCLGRTERLLRKDKESKSTSSRRPAFSCLDQSDFQRSPIRYASYLRVSTTAVVDFLVD